MIYFYISINKKNNQYLIKLIYIRVKSQKTESMKENQSDQNKYDTTNQLISVRVPFPVLNSQKISQYLTEGEFDRMIHGEDNIELKRNKNVNLTKKKLLRPLYQVRIVQYQHKITGQTLSRIQQCYQTTKCYDYTKMCDFYAPAPKTQDSIEEMKSLLRKKILQGENLDNYTFTVRPHAFLKPFNLSIQNNDLLVNKLESKSKKQAKSKHISFNEDIPNAPEEIPAYATNLKIFSVISQYLKKRPCWLRNVLEYQLKMDGLKGEYSANQLKNVLKFLTYTYRDGPWKHVFCRFGYNPTKENNAAIYQILMVKIKRKEVEDYDSKNQNSEEENDVYDPTFKEMPTKFLRIYQLCDIQQKRVQQLVRGARVSAGQCNKETGWFSRSEYSQLQRIIKNIREQRSKS